MKNLLFTIVLLFAAVTGKSQVLSPNVSTIFQNIRYYIENKVYIF